MEPLEKVPGLKGYFSEKKTATLDVQVASILCLKNVGSRFNDPKDPYPSPKNRRFDGPNPIPTIGLVRLNPEILGHTPWIFMAKALLVTSTHTIHVGYIYLHLP